MSRELKFKAWDPLKKEWAYGGTAFNLMGEITAHGFPDYLLETMVRWEFVQFTGLMDKNGKEIYEGDILEVPESNLFHWVVVFKNGCFGVSNIFKADKTILNDFFYCNSEYFFNDRVIIGNIYETPELLKPSCDSTI